VKRRILLALTLLTLAASSHAQLQFTSLDFPGGTLTTGRGINDYGEIVGAYRIDSPRHALLIKKGKFIPLAPTTILGTIYSEATNINDRGDITGQMIDDNGFAHGFLVVSDFAEFLYKTTDYWYPEFERTLLWSDPAVGIAWPIEGLPTLAAKDAAGRPLALADVYP